MAAMKVPLPTREPDLPVAKETLLAIDAKIAAEPRPWIVLGIAASHPGKEWSDRLLGGIRRVVAQPYQRYDLPDRRGTKPGARE